MKSSATPWNVWVGVFLLSFTSLLYPQNSALFNNMIAKAEPDPLFKPLFPYALSQTGANELVGMKLDETANVPTWEETVESKLNSAFLQSVFLNNDVFALYGKPGARNMGIVGQYTLENLEPVMNEFVAMYDNANGDRGIIPALYIIFGTCWPEGEIGILADATVRRYIDFARERGWLVYLDHQIGKYSVESAMVKLLPYLEFTNVHLALDPEWRTTKPMQEIGTITGEELNNAQKMMQDYLTEHSISGRKMLVVHQFKPKMITNRTIVRSDYERVQLIHCADGFGSPSLKKSTYALNAEATNIPLKSFKLFSKPTIDKAGYDIPIMSPDEVLSLVPRPYLIMYQ